MLRQLFWIFVLLIGLVGINDSINPAETETDPGISAPSKPSIEIRDGDKCCDPGPHPGCDPCGG